MMMPPLAAFALLNVLAACVLAGLAVTVARFLRAPGLRHLLWLLVLARLIAPPVFEWGLLPALEGTEEFRGGGAAEIATSAATAVTTVPGPGAATASPMVAGPIDPAGSAVGARGSAGIAAWLWLWGLGALALATLYGWRWWRFRTTLAEAVPAGADLASRAAELAARLGIPTAPEVLLCRRSQSPMVLPALRRPRVLLPSLLVEALTPGELDTVLLHELAHVRRRDYLVRVLETVVTVAYWWLPVVWWARSELRAAEELCCDEVVLAALPGSGRAYARGIMKTLEFVSPHSGVPALASGMSTFSRMEERLTMIMRPVSSQTFRRRRIVPLVIAVMTLGVFPTFAERSPQSDEDLSQQARAQKIAIEREALQVRGRQMEFKLRQLDARRELEAKQARIKLDQMDRQAQEFEAAGNIENAAEIRSTMAHLEQELKIAHARQEMEQEQMERMSRYELEVHGKRLEIEALRVSGRQVEAEQKLAELAEVEEALEREAMDGRRQEMALEERAMGARLENLRAEQTRLEAEGRSEDAARLADRIQHSEFQRQQMQLERAFEAQQRALQMKQRSLDRARERAVRERELHQVGRRFLDQVRELRRLASRLPDGGSTGRLLEELELEAERLQAESQPPETSNR